MAQTPEPTQYARKYYAAPEIDQIFPNQIKSFLTPLSPKYSGDIWNRRIEETIEKFQRDNLSGYTTRQLIDLDNVSNRELNPGTLKNPINAIIGRDRWTLRDWPPHIVSGGGRNMSNGYWQMENELVWNTVEPCLRLASRLFSNWYKHPWFDAIMLGARDELDLRRVPPSALLQTTTEELKKFKVVKLRDPAPQNSEECLEAMQALTRTVFWKYVRWGFKSQDRVPGKALNDLFAKMKMPEESIKGIRMCHGLTYFQPSTGHIDCWLTVELLEPLLNLNNDLTSSERLAVQLNVATIIVHELMHAFGHARARYSGHNNFIYEQNPNIPEPFFMDEPIAEFGWSGDNAMFGGIIQPWLKSPRPPLGLYIHNWPTSGMSRQMELISPPFPTYHVNSPIPVTFPEALHSEEFWASHFQNYGMLRLKPTSASYKIKNDPNSAWTVVRDPDDLEAVVQPHHTGRALAALLELTPEERVKQKEQMISAGVQELQTAINQRYQQATDLIAVGELCARFKGKPEYVQKVVEMIPKLEAMIATHEEKINQLLAFEVASGITLVDQRNDFQGFSRNLRLFTSRFLGIGYRPLEEAINFLLVRIEGLRLRLSPCPDNATGVTKTGALTAMAQAEVDENALLVAAVNAASAGDRETARRICNQLLTSLGCNLFAQACCRIIQCGDETIPVTERLREVHRALKTLTTIEPTPGWEVTLQDVKDQARNRINELSDIAMNDIDNLQLCCCGI